MIGPHAQVSGRGLLPHMLLQAPAYRSPHASAAESPVRLHSQSAPASYYPALLFNLGSLVRHYRGNLRSRQCVLDPLMHLRRNWISRIVKEMGFDVSYTLRIFGLTTPTLALLVSCGLLSPKGPQGKVDCPSIETTSGGQLCGIALRNILGPRDELLESVPMEQPEVLVASIDDASVDGDATTWLDMDPALAFSALKANPTALRIPTDNEGSFRQCLMQANTFSAFPMHHRGLVQPRRNNAQMSRSLNPNQ